ncbi:hypothetical protein DNTS_029930 [Danionella cerebrum]|uniref:Uncharacterized protein n=1 Tax=Danionella cerebrum TaxID=2873325 RepID=A0A553RPZ5_9TELE|nr:hypothetical protein DNTS_029930 [Danionella translucida]
MVAGTEHSLFQKSRMKFINLNPQILSQAILNHYHQQAIFKIQLLIWKIWRSRRDIIVDVILDGDAMARFLRESTEKTEPRR